MQLLTAITDGMLQANYSTKQSGHVLKPMLMNMPLLKLLLRQTPDMDCLPLPRQERAMHSGYWLLLKRGTLLFHKHTLQRKPVSPRKPFHKHLKGDNRRARHKRIARLLKLTTLNGLLKHSIPFL